MQPSTDCTLNIPYPVPALDPVIQAGLNSEIKELLLVNVGSGVVFLHQCIKEQISEEKRPLTLDVLKHFELVRVVVQLSTIL